MTSASLAVQGLVHAALTAAPGLAGLTGVFDWVAPDAAAPYVTIGADAVTDWSHKTGTGHEHRVQVSVWDDRPGTARLIASSCARAATSASRRAPPASPTPSASAASRTSRAAMC